MCWSMQDAGRHALEEELKSVLVHVSMPSVHCGCLPQHWSSSSMQATSPVPADSVTSAADTSFSQLGAIESMRKDGAQTIEEQVKAVGGNYIEVHPCFFPSCILPYTQTIGGTWSRSHGYAGLLDLAGSRALQAHLKVCLAEVRLSAMK